MRLLRLVLREMPEHLKMLAAMTAMAALSTTAVLWLVNEAAQEASKGTVGVGLALRFGLAIVLFAASQNLSLIHI